MTVRSNYMVDGAPLARAARHPPSGRSVPKGTLGILFAGLNCYHVPLPQGINEASGRSGAANITEKQVQVSIGPRSHSPCMRFENCVSQVTLP
jgi:hypothetical protein